MNVGKVLKGIGVLALILGGLVFLSFESAQKEPAPLIVANFADLSKIEKISKFRSCAGHVTVPQDGREEKRNMKHYFWVKPPYNKDSTVEIYAPYDGYVTTLRSEPELNLEGEVWIAPKRKLAALPPFGIWQFSVQHIDVREDLRRGSEVKAGELIGYAALSEKRGNSFDVVYGKLSLFPKKIDNWSAPFSDLDSVFNHMSDLVFTQYKEKGITSREGAIISREERDRNLCEYRGEGPYFANQDALENWVILKK